MPLVPLTQVKLRSLGGGAVAVGDGVVAVGDVVVVAGDGVVVMARGSLGMGLYIVPCDVAFSPGAFPKLRTGHLPVAASVHPNSGHSLSSCPLEIFTFLKYLTITNKVDFDQTKSLFLTPYS